MLQLLPITDPIAPARRGACPSLRQPMATGDGLLARLRLPERRVSPAQLVRIAELAARHGNGQLEITARGNLQVRGLSEHSAPRFAEAIEAFLPIETGLVVETPPLAGLDPTEHADPRPLATAIRVAAAPLAPRLGPKVTVVVDGGGAITLARLGADLRLTALDADRWLLALGKTPLGTLATTAALPATSLILQRLAELGPAARARDLDPAAIQAELATRLSSPAPLPAPPPLAGLIPVRDGAALPVALPFGSIAAPVLAALAQHATSAGITELRLAPGHALLALGAPTALAAFGRAAAALGLLTNPADPRLGAHACIGNEGCASGFATSRALASQLLDALPTLFDGTATLHVSGCPKGCAHPRPADITLVAQPGGWAVVLSGRASDAPLLLIPHADASAAFARLAGLLHAHRAPGQTSAAVLAALGPVRIAAALGPHLP
ncbi:precorrin-3B synthase [Devosia sp. 1635]|uniref:precorrin-3B synthase n=1 Tax=Devosia sp. 1635 TaxID=2726066 RepID=UPI0015669368|nr:precorrin-3B synthase [Devosia sp. 1635]